MPSQLAILGAIGEVRSPSPLGWDILVWWPSRGPRRHSTPAPSDLDTDLRTDRMKLSALLLPASAGLAAALLLVPGTGDAFNLLGGSLDLGQRDFRVHNNFTDVSANDNQTPDPQFPDATGAVRAIWAAVSEWGSELRKDGSGDPSQPGDLGSGGANFDSHFQGLAPDPGGTDDNVFSEIGGLSGGTLAFTELPTSDGWRIRFYRAVTWYDGPGAPLHLGNDHKDLQGVATHEYGHALGLDHSTISIDLTMFPGASTDFYGRRSLEADDIAGVQAIYGVKSPTKPRLARYDLAGGQLTVHGANFAASSNEVWFTRGSSLGDGTPVKVAGLASSAGGTRIDLQVPPEAGSGDLLVKVPGVTGDKLSNAYPFDIALGDCPPIEILGTAKTNSQSSSATMVSSGTPSVSYANFELSVPFGGIGGAPAILFYGTQPIATPFFGGTLYAGGPLKRDLTTTFGIFGDLYVPIPVTPAMVGQTRVYQLWYQDSGDANGVGLSNGIQVTFCP